jgi:TrmH family RNA methyltransferase
VPKTIASRQNPWFKRIREAVRDHADEIVIEGPKPVADAIASGWTPIATITRGEEAAQSLPWMIEPIIFHPDLFDALTETRSPQSIIGLFERPETSFDQLLARHDTVFLALDGVQDPGNVGTIVRLAAAFDAAGVALLPGCADPFGPKAIRASAGAILYVPTVNVSYKQLLGCGLPLHAADTAGALREPPSREAVIVFGNEGAGVSDELMRAATLIAIPTSARVESLNVAASAAILLSRSFALRGQR